MNSVITEIIVNWRPLPDGGEAFDKYTVGEPVSSGALVNEITEHEYSAGFYYNVYFNDNRYIKVFNPNYISFEKKLTNKKVKQNV